MNLKLNYLTRFGIYGLVVLSLILSGILTVSAQRRTAKKSVSAKNDNKKKAVKKTAKPAEAIEQPRNEDEFEGNQEKREEWFMSQRTFPSGELPDNARRNAFEAASRLAAPDSPAVPQWRAVGPAPTSSFFPNNWSLTSGRINHVAVSPNDPNLILVGAATGGVWRSTDGGVNFVPTTDSQVDLAVGSIAFAASNPSIVYAGMGDKASGYLGSGVLKSTDSGATWTRINNTTLPSPGRVSKIDVDPSNPNRVYVAQYSFLSGTSSFASGFYLSTDGGVNWTRTQAGLPRDFVRHPTQPNTLYLATARADGQTPTTGGVFKSIDAGLTWTRVYTNPLASTSNIKVAVTNAAPSNVYVMVGSGSTVQVEISTNEGANWTNKGSAFDTGQFSYNCYLFVNPANANTIYVGTRDMWRSTDGGTTYTNITNNFTIAGSYTPNSARSHPDQHHFYISPTNPNFMLIANDGGLWKTTDNATTFQSLNATLGLTMFVSLDIHPTDATRSYGGTQDNGTQKRNGSTAWREFATGDGGQTFVDTLDNSIVYTTYVYGAIYRYSNNGDGTRTTIGTDAIFNNDRVQFYPPFVTGEVDSTLYFGTYRLYTSTNRGASWTAGTTDLTAGTSDALTTIAVAKSNPNVIYTGSGQGRVMTTNNGGTTWTNITAGLPTRFIKEIRVSPTTPSTAYLTVSGYNSGHVFKTVDSGATWTNISGNLPDIPVNTIYFDPRTGQNALYVGTDIGVFRSTTDGATWENFNTGMPPVIVSEIDGQTGGILQAGTYGRGAYEINLNDSTRRVVADFDGDGKSDLSVFRPSNTVWYASKSSDNGVLTAQWGIATDKIVPADYNGDGKTDYAVFRAGFWYVLQNGGGFQGAQWGSTGDIPAPGDFDGDGKTDLSVFRNGVWYVLKSGGGTTTQQWGNAGDIPVVADFDADGKSDFGVYRNGIWYILRSTLGSTAIQWGIAGDKTVPADYNGDGKADFAVFRDGFWYILLTDGGFIGAQWGAAGDLASPADYDGDGKTDLAVFRGGTWYIQRTTAGVQVVNFGSAGDKPVANAFVP